MSQGLRMLVFPAIMFVLTSLVHYYLWRRLVRVPAWPAPWHRRLTLWVVVLAVSVPLSVFAARGLPAPWSQIGAIIGFSWMGLVFFLLLATLTGHAVTLVAWLQDRITRTTHDAPEQQAARVDRRLFLARLTAGAAIMATTGTGAYAAHSCMARVQVREVRVPLRRLPRGLDGLVIVQLTDLHFGPLLRRSFAEQIVATVNEQDADIVAITGDMVDGSVEQLRDIVAPLKSLRSKRGTFFVTGNHEYYSGVAPWIAHLENEIGMRVLANQHVPIEGPDGGFDLAGIHDFSGARFGPAHKPDLPRALAGRNPSRPVVLLAHQPRAVDEAARLGVDLQISGHTHGGQLWPFMHIVRRVHWAVWGLSPVPGSGTQIYVSAGTGFWGPPMRLGTKSEVTRIILESAPDAPRAT